MSKPFSAGLSFALFLNSSKTLPLAIVNSTDQVITWDAVADADPGAPNWLSLDRYRGSLQAHEVQTIYVTAQSGQATGDFQGTLTFRPSAGTAQKLLAELHVSIEVYSDNGPKVATGMQNRIEFVTQRVANILQSNPSSIQFSNPAVNGSVRWTMSSLVSWLDVTPNTGTLLGGGSQTVNVTVKPNAQAPAGTYTTDLILTFTFSDPAKAAHEPTSVLIPITVAVPSVAEGAEGAD
jgi:hypothetical protein